MYFLIVGIGFFILPHLPFFETNSLISMSSHINGAQLSFSEIAPSYIMYNDFGIKLGLFLLLLPNVAYSIFGLITPYATQAWSVGVEEQFYLVWPLLMKKIKNKELLFYFIIGGYLFIKLIVFNLIPIFFSWTDTVEHAWHFFYHTSIDCMAIGGLFALYLFRKDKKLIFLFNRKVQFVILFALLILIGFGVVIPYIHIEFYAVLFGILILNLAGNPKTIISLENKVFNYLGKISYGLYMYHSIAIMISIKVLNILGVNNIVLQHLSSLVITIIIAGLSYRFYEKYFINMKIKFSKIVSGDNAATASKLNP